MHLWLCHPHPKCCLHFPQIPRSILLDSLIMFLKTVTPQLNQTALFVFSFPLFYSSHICPITTAVPPCPSPLTLQAFTPLSWVGRPDSWPCREHWALSLPTWRERMAAIKSPTCLDQTRTPQDPSTWEVNTHHCQGVYFIIRGTVKYQLQHPQVCECQNCGGQFTL